MAAANAADQRFVKRIHTLSDATCPKQVEEILHMGFPASFLFRIVSMVASDTATCVRAHIEKCHAAGVSITALPTQIKHGGVARIEQKRGRRLWLGALGLALRTHTTQHPRAFSRYITRRGGSKRAREVRSTRSTHGKNRTPYAKPKRVCLPYSTLCQHTGARSGCRYLAPIDSKAPIPQQTTLIFVRDFVAPTKRHGQIYIYSL